MGTKLKDVYENCVPVNVTDRLTRDKSSTGRSFFRIYSKQVLRALYFNVTLILVLGNIYV